MVCWYCSMTALWSGSTGRGGRSGRFPGTSLQQVDAGGWYSEQYSGTRIPKLEDVIEYVRGRMMLNIEIKYAGTSSDLPEKVVDCIRRMISWNSAS